MSYPFITIDGERIAKSDLAKRYFPQHSDKSPEQISAMMKRDHNVDFDPKSIVKYLKEYRKEKARIDCTQNGVYTNGINKEDQSHTFRNGVYHLKEAVNILGKDAVQMVLEMMG